MNQNEKDLLEQKVVPTIIITDLISGEKAEVKVYENLISIAIGNKIVNLSSEQGITVILEIQKQLNLFKDLRKMELAEQLNASKLEEVKKLHLFYLHEPEDDTVILIEDKVEVIASEFCVTNADVIKYDERISAQKGVVKEIDLLKKEVSIKMEDNNTVIVHSSWLTFLERKTETLNP